jgi:multidrug efflux pump subunit AcrA (membrane-fusion protein)
VRVRLGRAGEAFVEILDGLREGDRLIRARRGAFKTGERVSVREETL